MHPRSFKTLSQSVHHAVPFVHSWHYAKLYPRLRRAWARLDCAPLEAPSLTAAFGLVVAQLRAANEDTGAVAVRASLAPLYPRL